MKTEQDLQQRLDMLPNSIDPQRDLWPELATRLAQTPQQSMSVVNESPSILRASWWLAAAAVGILALWAPWQLLDEPTLVAKHAAQVGSSTTEAKSRNESQWNYPKNDKTERTDHSRLGTVRVQASSETQWRLSSEFEQQRALQLAQIKQVPDIYRDWKQQLQIWKQATDLVLLALQYQPDEPGLLRKLSKLQQQELAYLQKVVQADPT